MNGQEMEKRIWSRVVEFLTTLDVFLATAKERTGNTQSASEMAQTVVKLLENQIKELDVADARAFGAYARSITSERTYVHAAIELKVERPGWRKILPRNDGYLRKANGSRSGSKRQSLRTCGSY
jgi:hypothetical protein